jgi:large subunit ribosomal protein L10
MSKYVKNLMVRAIAQRLTGVQDAVLVNVVGIDANQTVALRRELRAKDIHLLVSKTAWRAAPPKAHRWRRPSSRPRGRWP